METCVTTNTARVRDLVTCARVDDTLALVCSADRAPKLAKTFDMYIFPADDVAVADRSAEMCALSLVGLGAASALGASALLGADVPTPEDGRAQPLPDGRGFALAGAGLAAPGITLLVPLDDLPAARDALAAAPGVELGTPDDLETLRVMHGRPRAGAELTDDYNPLEAGLWRTVSFAKGCYIGQARALNFAQTRRNVPSDLGDLSRQETITRLNTYDGVKQQLWGLTLSDPVPPGTRLFASAAGKGDGDGEDGGGVRRAGVVTSVVSTAEGEHLGLGYVRTAVCDGPGITLTAEGSDARATTVDIPLATRGEAESAGKGEPSLALASAAAPLRSAQRPDESSE